MSNLSVTAKGLIIGICVTSLMTFILANVCEATCPTDSPFAIARQFLLLANLSAILYIIRLMMVIA